MREQMRMMEVRCCCQPQKVLGHLPVENERMPSVRYLLRNDRGEREEIELPIAEISTGLMVDPEAAEDIRLQEYLLSCIHRHRAIKAEGVALDTLRRIPSFVEAGNAMEPLL